MMDDQNTGGMGGDQGGDQSGDQSGDQGAAPAAPAPEGGDSSEG